MMRRLRLFARDSRASAGAEMALVLPMLIILLFGGMEGANYLWREHTVLKAVRDGARYASRLPFDAFDCTAGDAVTAPTDYNAMIGNVTRTSLVNPGSTTKIKVPGWDSNASPLITVSVTCDPDGDPGANFGLYTDLPDGAPIVRVAADVPYQSLFFNLGFAASGLSLRGSSQAAVMGL